MCALALYIAIGAFVSILLSVSKALRAPHFWGRLAMEFSRDYARPSELEKAAIDEYPEGMRGCGQAGSCELSYSLGRAYSMRKSWSRIALSNLHFSFARWTFPITLWPGLGAILMLSPSTDRFSTLWVQLLSRPSATRNIPARIVNVNSSTSPPSPARRTEGRSSVRSPEDRLELKPGKCGRPRPSAHGRWRDRDSRAEGRQVHRVEFPAALSGCTAGRNKVPSHSV